MAYDDYRLLHLTVERGICRATIDNPPINLLDVVLMNEIDRLATEAQPTTNCACSSSTPPTRSSS